MTGPATRPVKGSATASAVLGMALAGLIVLVSIGAESGPVLLVTGLVMATLPVPVYLALSLWIDRFEPEPRRLIVLTFLWGATVAVLVALVLNTAGEVIVGLTLGEGAAEIYGGSISAPVVEESAKALALVLIAVRRPEELNGIVDGIVYATMVGLGFAMTENVLYYSQGAFEGGVEGATAVFFARGLLSPFAHPLFTAMFGVGLGIASRSRSPSVRGLAPLAGLGAAIALHSVWNTAAGAGLALVAYVMLFVPIFLLMIAIVLIARSREGKLVREQLGPEVRSGWITPEELHMLGSVRARRRAARRARRAGGRDARRALHEVQEAATELAFHRDRAGRGLRTAGDTRAYQEQLTAALTRLRAVAPGVSHG